MPKYYTGIGSRETPEEILEVMRALAKKLGTKGYTLRTGGAPGADMAFLEAAHDNGPVEVYLPWRSFQGLADDKDLAKHVVRTEPQAPEAYEIASDYHPSWRYLKHPAKKLHARNVHQVLGYDVTAPEYSEFVICWTKDGDGGGGTGQAIRIAKNSYVPVFDLGDPSVGDLFASLV